MNPANALNELAMPLLTEVANSAQDFRDDTLAKLLAESALFYVLKPTAETALSLAASAYVIGKKRGRKESALRAFVIAEEATE